MQIVESETSLVVAGAWNRAILTPDFMLRYGLNDPAQQVQVIIPTGVGGVIDLPKFILSDFSYVVRPDSLVLAPKSHDAPCFSIMEKAAGNILKYLQYTPISGVGFNCLFSGEIDNPSLGEVFRVSNIDLIDGIPSGWEVAESSIVTNFKSIEGYQVNIQRVMSDNRMLVNFNFHHQVSSAEGANQLLTESDEPKLEKYINIAKSIVDEVYGARS